MPEDEDAHLRLIHRWLSGDTVDGDAGIRLSGGPFDGRTRIVRLDGAGNPPPRTRGRSGGTVWHVYVLESAPEGAASWVYRYHGTEPVELRA